MVPDKQKHYNFFFFESTAQEKNAFCLITEKNPTHASREILISNVSGHLS